MMKLIDKDLLVKEIKERIQKIVDMPSHTFGIFGKRSGYEDILSFIDTLEVKENGLVEELDYDDYMTFFKEHPEYNNGNWGFEETWTFAQYCYKLGLKAQKGDKE